MKRKLLFILSTAPYGSSLASEALDAVLVAAVFEQEVSVLYMGDGLFQLVKDQSPEALHTRNQAKASRALPEYDVESVFVDAETLKSSGLSISDLVLPVIPLTPLEINSLIARQHAVLNF